MINLRREINSLSFQLSLLVGTCHAKLLSMKDSMFWSPNFVDISKSESYQGVEQALHSEI